MVRDEVVFAVDGEEFRWRDVLLAAVRSGDWHALERRAREGWALAAQAADSGAPFPSDEVDAAGREFRYDRDLLTAQSMEEWLDRWQLSIPEWTAYLSRQVYRAAKDGPANGVVQRYPIPDEDAPRVLAAEAVCSKAMQRWKRKLAERAAIPGAGTADPARPAGDSSLHTGESTDIVASLLGLRPDELRESASRLDRLDAAFDAFRASKITERALQEYVSVRQLDWMRFNCRMMAFPDEMMASEAALLLTEDDEGFTGVYSAAHAEPRAAEFFLDEMDSASRDKFVGARAGDLVGPLQVNGEFVLYLVLDKTLPSTKDPIVRRRAEEGVLKKLLERHVTSRVRWPGAAS